MESLIQIGQIVGVHGIKGLVRIKPSLNDVSLLTKLKPVMNQAQTTTFDIQIKGQKGDHLLCTVRGITDRTTAEKLRGTKLFVPRSSLPKEKQNEFYYCDLVGCVVMTDDKPFGTIQSVNNYGAGDIVDIQTPDETVSLVLTKENFPKIDIEHKTVYVLLPRGLKGDKDED